MGSSITSYIEAVAKEVTSIVAVSDDNDDEISVKVLTDKISEKLVNNLTSPSKKLLR